MEDIEEKNNNLLVDIFRWIVLLPASAGGSYVTYMFIFWLNRSKDYPYTTFDGIWDYGADIERITLGEAKEMGRTPCHFCH